MNIQTCLLNSLDPGNWSVDFLGGSQFGYTLLFVILVSNLIAIFLQNLAIRLGTVSGLDLAAASRQYLSRRLNLFLYVLAEIAIIATDVAEVIGSAIALTLLFPSLSLPVGVAITAADVFIILLFYKEENNSEEHHDIQAVQYFEWFVMALVTAVGVCFVIELTLSPVVMGDVMRGFLPSSDIIKDPECLYVAIGIIGATVMPHNLFLHSFIVQSRCHVWRSDRPTLVESSIIGPIKEEENGSVRVEKTSMEHDTITMTANPYRNDDHDDTRKNEENFDAFNSYSLSGPSSEREQPSTDATATTAPEGAVIVATEHHKQHQQNMTELRNHIASQIDTNLHYSFVDLIVALFFAFFINTAILVVASANFHQTSTSATSSTITDLFDAHDLLKQYIGSIAAFVFAIALLCAGQSSTLTATLAGQVVMSGFLGMTTRPWLRRLVTRGIAIVPAMVAACWAGRSGLSQMLVASQVALSIQLPFAVVPLVWFTSSPEVMKMDLIKKPATKKPGATATSAQQQQQQQQQQPLNTTTSVSKGRAWIRKTTNGLLATVMPKSRHSVDPEQHEPFLHHHEEINNSSDIIEEDEEATCMTDLSPSTSLPNNPYRDDMGDLLVLPSWPDPLTYANSPLVLTIAGLVAGFLISLNIYLVFTTLFS